MPQNSIKASDIAVSMIIDSNSTGLAFLWEMTPVLGTEALPIYSTDEFKLPGAPWWISFNESNKIDVSYN